MQIPSNQSLSIPFHSPPSSACSPFTGNLSSRVVPVTNCFQAVSNARCLEGALICRPPSRPLAWSPNTACCLWLLAGLPTISARSNSSHALPTTSFILRRVFLLFECQSRRKGNVRGDSTDKKSSTPLVCQVLSKHVALRNSHD